MSNQFLIDLAPGWALGFEKLQWVLFRADKRPLEGEKSLPGVRWRGVAFIATTKAVLRRCIHEYGIELTPEATAYLDGLPEKFREWRRQHQLRVVPEEMEAA